MSYHQENETQQEINQFEKHELKFRIRCSAIGQIMTNARSKSDALSKTAMNYCQEWLKEQLYGRRKDITNKYTEKGNIMEDNALDFIALNLGYDELIKNEQYFSNDFLTGVPDVVLDDHVIDVKNSWDCFTFPLFFKDIPNKDYYWQSQGYMALTNKSNYKLIYCLMDTPRHLIEKEFKFSNHYDLDYNDFEKHFLYSNIENKYRMKIFNIEKNDEDIEKIHKRVIECRNYINNIGI